MEVLKLDIQESIGLVIRGAMSEDVVDTQPALSAGWDENDDRFAGRIFDDGEVCGFRHGDHERGEMGDSEGLEMNIHIQWTSTTKPIRSQGKLRHDCTYLGEKLKMACDGAPIHSLRSLAFASETPQATIRVAISVCAETYLVREIINSYVGPTSPPTSWIASGIRRPMFRTYFRCRHRRERTSHYGGGQ